jgi:phosphoribosylamine-glycine ligase
LAAAPSASAVNALAQVDWPQGFFRRDIGWRVLKAFDEKGET